MKIIIRLEIKPVCIKLHENEKKNKYKKEKKEKESHKK